MASLILGAVFQTFENRHPISSCLHLFLLKSCVSHVASLTLMPFLLLSASERLVCRLQRPRCGGGLHRVYAAGLTAPLEAVVRCLRVDGSHRFPGLCCLCSVSPRVLGLALQTGLTSFSVTYTLFCISVILSPCSSQSILFRLFIYSFCHFPTHSRLSVTCPPSS